MPSETTLVSDSILLTIKKMLGIEASYAQFDTDIITLINNDIAILRQLGVGPKNGFRITGENNTWFELIGYTDMLETVKTHIFLRVKRLFDPPTSSFVLSAMAEDVKELEWRLNVTADCGEELDE